MSLESVQHHVVYNAQHKVLICKTHQCGITDVRHFRGQDHVKMSTKTRLQIRVATQHLEMPNPSDIKEPPSTAFPIDDLELIKDGFKCKICEYLAGTFNTMEEHCRIEHGRKAKDEIMWTAQAMQTFFSGKYIDKLYLILGKYTKYFAVTLPISSENQTITDQMIEG